VPGYRTYRLNDELGHEFITHSGVVRGFRSFVDCIPKLKLGWAILVNREDADLGGYVRDVVISNLIDEK